MKGEATPGYANEARSGGNPFFFKGPFAACKAVGSQNQRVAGSESDCPRGDDALSVTDNHGDDEVTGDIELCQGAPVPTAALVDMDVTKGDIRVFFVIGKGLFYVRRWINHGKLFRRPGSSVP